MTLFRYRSSIDDVASFRSGCSYTNLTIDHIVSDLYKAITMRLMNCCTLVLLNENFGINESMAAATAYWTPLERNGCT